MDFKDYYATLGIQNAATQDDVKRAYRKLARKFHPDVSQEPNAEARFKDIAEAHEALIDPERRAAYDELARQHAAGAAMPFSDVAAQDDQGEAMAHQDFFEMLFGHRPGTRARGTRGHATGQPFGASPPVRHAPAPPRPGIDEHASIELDLMDVFRPSHRTIHLQMPEVTSQGHVALRERRLEVDIPKGMRTGQHLRLAGQGGPGQAGGPAGDLYLKVHVRPHPRYHVDGRDIQVTLPVAPWEAALGAEVTIATPEGEVELRIPPGSISGHKMRLKGRGIPGDPAGHFYALLTIALPPANTPTERAAWDAFALAFGDFKARPAEQGHP